MADGSSAARAKVTKRSSLIWRSVVGVLCLAVVGLAVVSWTDNDGRVVKQRVERETQLGPVNGKSPLSHTVRIKRRRELPSDSLRSEPLMIALVTVGAVLAFVFLFWDRVEEISFGNVRIRLDSKRLQEFRERIKDPEKAMEALGLYLEQVETAVDEGQPVSTKMADKAAEAAIKEVQSDLGEQVEIKKGDGEEVRVEGRPEEPGVLWATSEHQYLSPKQFPAELVAEIERAESQDALRLYVLEEIEVLAAASYETLDGAPILLHALTAREDRPELPAQTLAAALLVTQYLHQISIELERPPGLVIAMGSDDLQSLDPVRLQELGFRPARPGEVPGLPEAAYWIQDQS